MWASRRTQEARFDAMLRLADPHGANVLDVGCGCGDLVDFLVRRGVAPAKYVGLEGVGELADVASRKRPPGIDMSIVRADFIAEPWRLCDGHDIVYCSGALNTIDDGDFYATIRNAFEAAGRALVFNFLSSPLLAGEPYLRWRYRRDVLSFARSLHRQVDVLEDYLEGDCTIAILRPARTAS